MSEERKVKINGIPISNAGFTNLQFETSKSSNSVNTIRGFGSLFKEENLNIIQTVSMDFDLKSNELENLAYIYTLFKACGILPIENEYLLNKVGSTYTQSKNKKQLEKDDFSKSNISHLVCLLERMNINSLEKTSDGYKVNLVLTLYDSALTQNEFDEYINKISENDSYKEFEKICKDSIRSKTLEFSNLDMSGVTLEIYNIEKLNAKYKTHLLNNVLVNNKLNKETESENEYKANELRDKTNSTFENNKEIKKDKDGNIISTDPYAPTKIYIENKHILQIEFITHNKISNLPLLGSPIFTKSYLGIGETFFNIKCIFKEEENNIVNELKSISDKNIINHKIELHHPLVQLFDFHSANIVNIVFNNLEQANGIMVNIIFSLNGFRYAEEENINIDEILSSVKYNNDEKQELVGGLYLEYLLDYLYNNKDVISDNTILNFLNHTLETKTFNSSGGINDTYEAGLLSHSYLLASLFASYSSFPSSYGIHKQLDNKVFNVVNIFFNNDSYDFINSLTNKDVSKVSKQLDPDFFLLNYRTISQISDSDLNIYRALYKAENYYALIDNVVLVSLFGNSEYKKYISDELYQLDRKNLKQKTFVNIIRNCVSELFNSKQNFSNDIISSVIKKIYEEFLFRSFYIINNKLDSEYSFIDDLNNYNYFFTHDGKLNFKTIHLKIKNYVERIYSLFLKSLNDSYFIERIIRESVVEYYTSVEKLKIDIDTTIKELSKEVYNFELEFTNVYELNKSIIIDRAYNIFLTKYLYLVSIYSSNRTINSKYQINFSQMLKSFILSSSLHSLLLARTTERTDHFDNPIILGLKNIGYKISLYNQHLYKNNNEHIMFSEFFNLKSSYYVDKVNTSDCFYSTKNMFDDNVKKDINFFYGKLIKINFNDSLHYIKNIISNKEQKEDLKMFFDDEREKFIKNKDLDFENYNGKTTKYSLSDLDTEKIEFPLIHGGYLPSYFNNFFFKKDKNMTERMKQRIIASKDPFKDLENLTNIVYDFNNYVIPDYDVMICKKYQFMNFTSGEEMVGDAYKKINNRSYLMLKNVSSISIVKNPKTKIKVANIILNDVSKSIFNFDPFNGSFDLKTLKNNKIDILHIEVGDEIRVRLGYGKNIQVFNGFIQEISGSSNQLMLSCSSFASGLYSEVIENITVDTHGTLVTEYFKKVKTNFESLKSSLKKILPEQIEVTKNYFYSIKPINSFLFKELNDKNKNYNVPFTNHEQSSLYSTFVLTLQTVSSRILFNFTPKNILNITTGSLSHDSYIKASLKSIFGSISLPNEVVGASPDLLININNVDSDYDCYGIKPSDIYYYNDKDKIENEISKADKIEDSVDNKILNTNEPEYLYSSDTSQEKYEPTELGIEYFPVSLKDSCYITSLFNEKRTNKKGETYFHQGLDFVTKAGNIYSVADGKVIRINEDATKATGLAIYIEHVIPNSDKTFVSAYYHLKEIKVNKNYNCKAGELIGIMGNTGNSSGKHLHFEMYTNNKGNAFNKNKILNPFYKERLPKIDTEELMKIIAWDKVNIMADNGQYSKELHSKYTQCKKYKEYRGEV